MKPLFHKDYSSIKQCSFIQNHAKDCCKETAENVARNKFQLDKPCRIWMISIPDSLYYLDSMAIVAVDCNILNRRVNRDYHRRLNIMKNKPIMLPMKRALDTFEIHNYMKMQTSRSPLDIRHNTDANSTWRKSDHHCPKKPPGNHHTSHF